MVAIGKQAWFALLNRKSRTAPPRSPVQTGSPVQTRPRLLRGSRGRLELTGKIIGIAARTDQIDHLAAELRWIWEAGFRQDDIFRESVRGVPPSGSIPPPALTEPAFAAIMPFLGNETERA